VHDINLPYGLNRKAAIESHIHWTEQYLLMAYLLENPRTSVLVGSNWATRALTELVTRLVRGRSQVVGRNFWFEQRAPG
jgi:hypothetical protein